MAIFLHYFMFLGATVLRKVLHICPYSPLGVDIENKSEIAGIIKPKLFIFLVTDYLSRRRFFPAAVIPSHLAVEKKLRRLRIQIKNGKPLERVTAGAR